MDTNIIREWVEKDRQVNRCIRNVWLHLPVVLSAATGAAWLAANDYRVAAAVVGIGAAAAFVSMARQMCRPYQIIQLATDM